MSALIRIHPDNTQFVRDGMIKAIALYFEPQRLGSFSGRQLKLDFFDRDPKYGPCVPLFSIKRWITGGVGNARIFQDLAPESNLQVVDANKDALPQLHRKHAMYLSSNQIPPDVESFLHSTVNAVREETAEGFTVSMGTRAWRGQCTPK
jgi:hypothetical protein